MPIRVLFFHHAIGMGGAPRSLAFLIKSLDKSEFEPIVVMPKRPNNDAVKGLFLDAGAEVHEEVHIRPFNGVNGAECSSLAEKRYALLAAIPCAVAAAKWIRKLDPSIVHVNTCVLPFAVLGARLSTTRRPVVVHVRETVLRNRWGRLLALLNRMFASHFICIDNFGLQEIGAKRSSATVIQNFVDLANYNKGIQPTDGFREGMGCDVNDIIFLSLSRVTHVNGILELAQLVLENDQRLPKPAKFVVAGFHGECEYSRKIRTLAAGNRRLVLLDFIDDVIPIIAASDVNVVPFVTPHNARSVLETAAMGKPSLVSTVPNLLELVDDGKTGFCFELGSAEQFVSAVNRLCDLQVRQAMGAAAAEFAAENFDATRNVARTMDVYRSLLNQ